MTQKEIATLKKNALALRNIASLVLEQVEREEQKRYSSSTAPKARITKAQRIEQEVYERILTGRRKPKSIRKT
jgi:hypothetical protein